MARWFTGCARPSLLLRAFLFVVLWHAVPMRALTIALFLLVTPALANSESLVRFDTNSYSVPTKYAYREITVVATVDEVRLVFENRLVARHPRHWGREQYIFNPVHYLALLERKPGGLDHARPLEDWDLPKCFDILRQKSSPGSKPAREAAQMPRTPYWVQELSQSVAFLE